MSVGVWVCGCGAVQMMCETQWMGKNINEKFELGA